jgi:tetratricopeptide (TPR) repeat protein
LCAAAGFVLLATCRCASASRFEDALTLQRQRRFAEARAEFQQAASDFHAGGDRVNEAKALGLAGEISVSLGDYRAAISDAAKAVAIWRSLKDEVNIREDLNTLGLANVYMGNFAAALPSYQEALQLDRAHRIAEAEIVREGNIGNVYYFQGRYSEALRWYQMALEKADATRGEMWNPRRRQVAVANLATLYQRVGQEQRALDLYRQLAAQSQAMPRSEQAQLLVNQGILYRRLGDPIKALERYGAARNLYSREGHRDGEISVLRSVGLARAVDLHDLPGALEAFTSAWELARHSSNARGMAQAKLYRAETLFRLRRLTEAEHDAREALDAARAAGLPEEVWEAQYTLGRVAQENGQTVAARGFFQTAITGIESIRAGVGLAMRNEFLADKRDVYDAMIALRLAAPDAAAEEIFSWIERSRTRTLLDRVRPSTADEPSLAQIQSRLAPETVLLELWMGPGASATIWIASDSAGVVRHTGPSGDTVSRLAASLQNTDDAWKEPAQVLGRELLAGVPLRRHIVVVPDGPLGTVSFEALLEPGSRTPLIETHDISYLPSAQFTQAPKTGTRWIAPWVVQLVAFGDPPVEAGDLAPAERWQRLTASADEVTGIARLLGGRSRVYLGAEARKRYLVERGAERAPVVHFSTHALVDNENPDRSRILMAADYLFEREVYELNLTGVDLTTISACDTAQGKLIRGEGVEAFSRAFLAAGSAATVTSLWRVPDAPTADFMKLMYFHLSQGRSKSEALRLAKLEFLRSNTQLAHPRYWAAFVLNGDGWNTIRRATSWSGCATTCAVLMALASLVLWQMRRTSAIAPARR